MSHELRPGYTPTELRDLQREVALTYRRVDRAGKAEGLSPPDHHRRAYDSMVDKYLELMPDTDRKEAARAATQMLANAINRNTRWFWHGGDA